MTTEIWSQGFDVAVHVIGDLAAQEVSEAICCLWDTGHRGVLHLEHVETMNAQTIRLLKGRSVICHMQPCHYLTDHRWLKEKLGPLEEYIFPWAALEENKIAFDFGSDSPIEAPSIQSTLEALSLSEKNQVRPLKQDPLLYHSHSSEDWVPRCWTELSETEVQRTVFAGETIYQSPGS
jgi:predicted amidohydrolase YtcJ